MRIPAATYRLQLSERLTLADAAGLVDYLDELGITDVYVSPIATARRGSVHGYDVVDHGTINPELGGEEAFARLTATLRDHKMAMLLDIVPNHMCIAGDANQCWLDLLENGQSATFARFFDVDWRPPKPELVNRVLLPVLGDQYGRVLERGISVVYESGAFFLAYDQTRLPLAPRTWTHLLDPALAALRERFGDEEPRVLELESIIRAIGHLPVRSETAPAKVRERRHEVAIIRQRLAALLADHEDAYAAVRDAIRGTNGRRDDPQSFDRLERLVADQAYRPSHWRVAAHEINYRRFFDINDLAAIRVEDPVVFAAVHALPLRLARDGIVTGFRIDHVDGLYDPEKYLLDLRQGFRDATGADEGPFVVVEKILTPDERLPVEWATQGTTGYEFTTLVTSVLVDPTAGARLRDLPEGRTGGTARFPDVAYRSKKLVLRSSMSAELAVLARRLDRISEQHRYTRDFTMTSLHEVLTEVIACFPVYRTYVRPGASDVDPRDRVPIEIAIRSAKRRNPVINESLFDFLRAVLLLADPEGLTDAQRAERRELTLRFQQLTGPVMAKGLEDTAFYRYAPLAALNEVGGDPDAFGFSVEEFHRHAQNRARTMPHGLSATATHDTKRGEDTRARLLILSEAPELWTQTAARWQAMNRRHKTDVGGIEAPDAFEEYLLYQTLVGVWPAGGRPLPPDFVDRIQEYMRKALLEAKVHTSWINHNAAYESAVAHFVDAVLDPARDGAFVDDVARFVNLVAGPGFGNGLAQVLLKIASPGVPDIYRGTELWDFSLVDPDNRRPVDYEARRAHLAALRTQSGRGLASLCDRLLERPEDGRIKMLVTTRALHARRSRRALFEHGDYQGLAVLGAGAENVVAFARTADGEAAIAVTGRHFARLAARLGAQLDARLATQVGSGEGMPWRPVGPATWGDTKLVLPETLLGRRWQDVLTDRLLGGGGEGDPSACALPLAEVFAHLPIALLVAIP